MTFNLKPIGDKWIDTSILYILLRIHSNFCRGIFVSNTPLEMMAFWASISDVLNKDTDSGLDRIGLFGSGSNTILIMMRVNTIFFQYSTLIIINRFCLYKMLTKYLRSCWQKESKKKDWNFLSGKRMLNKTASKFL